MKEEILFIGICTLIVLGVIFIIWISDNRKRRNKRIAEFRAYGDSIQREAEYRKRI